MLLLFPTPSTPVKVVPLRVKGGVSSETVVCPTTFIEYTSHHFGIVHHFTCATPPAVLCQGLQGQGSSTLLTNEQLLVHLDFQQHLTHGYSQGNIVFTWLPRLPHSWFFPYLTSYSISYLLS